MENRILLTTPTYPYPTLPANDSLTDATVTLGRRLMNKERVFSAHKSHFYQRAVAHGLRVPQVTARVFALGLALMGLAIVAALARSLAVDVAALGLGAAVTGFVLFNFSRGR